MSFPLVIAFFVSLFLSLNVYVYPLEHAIMTDSLASSFLIVISYLLVRLVRHPTRITYVLFGILSTTGWLLRPNLLLVPLITLPLLLLVKTNRKYMHMNLCTFSASLLLPIVFVFLNATYHGYTGISQINEINLLGRILEFNLPVDAGKRYTTYYNAVLENRITGGPTMPYRFLDTYAPLTYTNTKRMNELQQFDRAVIANNFSTYIIRALSFIPNIFSDGPPLLGIDTNKTTGLAGIYAFLWHLYRSMWHLGYLLFLLFPIAILSYVRKPSLHSMIAILLGIISLTQLLVIVLFDYYDPGQYARLSSVIQPQVYLFIFITIYEVVCAARSTIRIDK